MTQPDLVSKLREVIAKVKPLVEKATPMPWSTNSQFIPQASAKILVGSDRRSIAYVGMNPQSKEWETYAQDITNTLLIIAAVNAMDELESLLGREGQAAPLRTPGEDVWIDEIMLALGLVRLGDSRNKLRTILRAYRANLLSQPSPSTPIVPGTAGLSAEQVLEIANRHRVTVAGYEFADKFDFEGIAADLNALLGATKPAGLSLTMERARNLSRSYLYGAMGHLGISVLKDEAVESVAERLFGDFLAERPAPVGEVKGEK